MRHDGVTADAQDGAYDRRHQGDKIMNDDVRSPGQRQLIESAQRLRGNPVKWAAAVVAVLIALVLLWPFYSVPTGSRGVITQFGKIVGIEGEGLAVLPPWQKLSNFSIRAEKADIENAEGSTSDTQPVKVSMTVRYSIATDRVATAPDLIAQRAKVSNDINAALREKLSLYGAQVINIDMRNFAFSDSYMRAINDKVTQEQ